MEGKNKHQFQYLLERYKSGTCTPEEVREMFNLLKSDEFDRIAEDELQNEFDLMFPPPENKTSFARVRRLKKFFIPAAASVFILLSWYFFFYADNVQKDKLVQVEEEVIEPGTDHAILTYGNGKTIILDSNTMGNIAILNGTVASVKSEGELTLESGDSKSREPITNNKITIPTGGFFKIILPDGTIVWLNSESELNFPSRFEGKQRIVSLKGEGYFEVATDKKKPFLVQLKGEREIKVYGTVFNVMAYENEPVQKITLIEGSVSVSNDGAIRNLKPNEQAVLKRDVINITDKISVDHEIAWKNGLFDFQNEDLPTVLRRISRWYNVEISYNSYNQSSHYAGSIRKSSGIRDVLRMLEIAGDVEFSIVGKRIIVNGK